MQAHYPDFIARVEAEDRPLPEYVREEFDAYLRCGVLEHGFLRVVCEQCHAERLLPFSCKKRGFCPSCGARRMAESARHLVETVFGPLSGIGEKWLWIRAQTGACVAPAYPTDWPKRTFEFPILEFDITSVPLQPRVPPRVRRAAGKLAAQPGDPGARAVVAPLPGLHAATFGRAVFVRQ